MINSYQKEFEKSRDNLENIFEKLIEWIKADVENLEKLKREVERLRNDNNEETIDRVIELIKNIEC